VRSIRRKIAGTLLADLLETPAEQAWMGLSTQLRDAEGPSIYERELVPGFEGTLGEARLWRPSQEAAEELSEEKNEKKRTKKFLTTLNKISADESSTWEYEEGGRPNYYSESNPTDGAYSDRLERDNSTGVDIAWGQVGPAFYPESQMPEPPLLNQANYNTGTPERYEQ
jgi:hypothetical protein